MSHRSVTSLNNIPVDIVVSLVRDPDRFEDLFKKWRDEERKIRTERAELEEAKQNFEAEMKTARESLEGERFDFESRVAKFRSETASQIDQMFSTEEADHAQG